MLNKNIQNALDKLPYDFVPIVPELAVLDEPMPHDQAAGHSGEIWIEIEALTPLLVGNYRYTLQDLTDKAKNELQLDPKFDARKSILEPLCDDQGRVLIAGSSLTGMLRASISALLSAPMERVTERSYSYRLEASLLKPFYIESTQPYCLKKVRVSFKRNHWSIKARYVGGMDGTGKLAKAFDKQQKKTTKIHQYVRVKIEGKCMGLPKKALRAYQWTQEHLADIEHGHLSSRHPLTHEDPSLAKRAAKDIKNNAELTDNQLIYAHVHQGQILSIGHHFRYRQAYSSTVRKKFIPKQQIRQTREELKPRPKEIGKKPAKLSAARLLFGYVMNEQEHSGTCGIGQKDFGRWAGRLAFNMAVEQCADPQNPERFYNQGKPVVLKVLGTPRPSAVECYLDQSEAQGNILQTYGDHFGESGADLRGRKFYPHQPKIKEEHFLENDSDKKKSQLSTIARLISDKGTKFRCKLRYQHLREWELGAVLLSLDPSLMRHMSNLPEQIREELDRAPFAHKLGYAQPLGLGSVRLHIQPYSYQDEKRSPLAEQQIKQAVQALEQKMQPLLQNDQGRLVIRQWLKMHQFSGPIREYPGGNNIFAWHSRCRRNHLRDKYKFSKYKK